MVSMDGVTAATPRGAKGSVLLYFSKLTGGSIVAPSSLVVASQNRLSCVISRGSIGNHISVMQLHNFVVLYLSSLNPSKAGGEDGIPPSLLKQYPKRLADILMPYLVCCIDFCCEPIMWSGGNLCDIPPKVSSFDVIDRTGILLEDNFAKCLHSFVRSCLTPHLES